MRTPTIAPACVGLTAEVEVAQLLRHGVSVAVGYGALDDPASNVAAGALGGLIDRLTVDLADAFAGNGRGGEEEDGEEEQGEEW